MAGAVLAWRLVALSAAVGTARSAALRPPPSGSAPSQPGRAAADASGREHGLPLRLRRAGSTADLTLSVMDAASRTPAWPRCCSCSAAGRARASVGYPTIESFQFGQEITFSHNGKPFLIYTSRTWRLDEDGTIGAPLATETGFWRPQPDSELEVLLAHPTGFVEIYLGEIAGTRIDMATDAVVRTASRPRKYTAGRRLYGLIGTDLG